MKQIRNCVFETNSSSTHSVSIRHNNVYHTDSLPVSRDGFVHISLDSFGWEIENYCDAETKLSYLLTMSWEVNSFRNAEALMESSDFRRIERAVKNRVKCKGLKVDDVDGYIDHQSYEDYGSLDDFLNDWGTDIDDFIFNCGVVLHTDNDNH